MLDFLLIYSKNNTPLSDNILDPFIEKKIEDCLFDYKQAFYFTSPRKDRFAIFCSTDIQSHLSCFHDNEHINFFDGIIIQEKACIDIRDIKPILGRNEQDHSEVFGNYCYGLFSKNGVNHVHGIVLGHYSLFIGFSSHITVISNNPHLAAHAIHGNDYKNYKSIKNLAWLSIAHSIKDLTTSYEGVFFFPQNSGTIIEDDNSVSFYSLCDNLYYKMDHGEWNERFETTHKKLVNFLPLYYSKGSEYQIGAEITGGFDSRVTLALAIEAGIHKKITWTVRGYKDHPDVVIARSIAKKFDLTLDWYLPKEYSEDEIESVYNTSLLDLHRSGGMTQYSELWTLDNKLSPFMLSGIAGEMFRSYISTSLAESGLNNTILDDTTREFLFRNELIIPTSSLTPTALDYYHKRLMTLYKSFDELYSCDLVPCRTRQLQFHGGLFLRSTSPYLCCIGYNSWLHRLSMIEAPELRASNDIAFKLIEKPTPKLLYFPLDYRKWPFMAYANSKESKRISKIKPFRNKKNIPGQIGTYLSDQLCLLLSNDIRIHETIYQVHTKKYVDQLTTDSAAMIVGKMETDKNVFAKTIDLLGLSIFLNNQELTSVSKQASPSIDGHLLSNLFNETQNIYTPLARSYKEPARNVIDNIELCFQKKKVFSQSDHDMLPPQEQKQFAFRMKKDAMSDKDKIKALIPKNVLNLYHTIKGK